MKCKIAATADIIICFQPFGNVIPIPPKIIITVWRVVHVVFVKLKRTMLNAIRQCYLSRQIETKACFDRASELLPADTSTCTVGQ